MFGTGPGGRTRFPATQDVHDMRLSATGTTSYGGHASADQTWTKRRTGA